MSIETSSTLWISDKFSRSFIQPKFAINSRRKLSSECQALKMHVLSSRLCNVFFCLLLDAILHADYVRNCDFFLCWEYINAHHLSRTHKGLSINAIVWSASQLSVKWSGNFLVILINRGRKWSEIKRKLKYDTLKITNKRETL